MDEGEAREAVGGVKKYVGKLVIDGRAVDVSAGGSVGVEMVCV